MTQQNLLELAKQGDAKAIAALINRQLHSKGILAKAALVENCLQIILEATSIPPQQKLVAYIQSSMSKLGASSIQKVKIYGKQSGNDFPAWDQEFELPPVKQVDTSKVISNIQVVSPITRSNSSKGIEDTILLECHGNATTLIVKGSGVLIRRPEKLVNIRRWSILSVSYLTNSDAITERFISYKNISNIQFHSSGTMSYGFIYFQIVGSSIGSIKYLEAPSNPDAVVFYNEKLKEFDQARLLIAENISLPPQNAVIQKAEQQNSPIKNVDEQVRCPKCGSTQINANKKGFNIGQALVGGVVTVGVGLVAGLWGSNEIRLNCLRCGHRWKPKM